MGTPQRNEFLKWWEAEKESRRVFNLREEMLKYCRADGRILREATLKFRQLFMTISTVDPLDNVTIAGACMSLFRQKFPESSTDWHSLTQGLPG